MVKSAADKQKEEIERARKAAAEKAERKRKQLADRERKAFAQVSNTENGRVIFRYLMRECGFTAPSVNVDPKTGEIFTDNTVYNEARRGLYLNVRKQIPVKNLVKIEFNLEAAEDDDDDI